jgi:antibiotic biosynthesis monooxygenase (ABM) superfamily enzyme
MTRPPRYKMAVVTWIAIYPLITLLLWAFSPFIVGVPVPLVTLALSAALVTLQTYVVMPLMMRVFRRWLFPRPASSDPAPS